MYFEVMCGSCGSCSLLCPLQICSQYLSDSRSFENVCQSLCPPQSRFCQSGVPTQSLFGMSDHKQKTIRLCVRYRQLHCFLAVKEYLCTLNFLYVHGCLNLSASKPQR